MCRGNDHGGRRCPGDTSEARRLRNHNRVAKNSYTDLVTPPLNQTNHNDTILGLEESFGEPFSVEQLRNNIHEFNQMLNDMAPEDETEQKLIEIGLGVEYLAETKYGAPKDHEIKNIHAQEVDSKVNNVKLLNDEKKAAFELEENLREQLLATGINRNSHPIISERLIAWENHYPELYAAFVQAQSDSADMVEKIIKEKNKKPQIKKTVELFEKRNQAVKQALEEIGVEFAQPNSLIISTDSHTDAVKSLHNALQFYPQAWVDYSNQNVHNKRIDLIVKRSNGRAHYNPFTEQKKFYFKSTFIIEEKPDGWVPDPHDRHEAAFFPTDENNIAHDPLGSGRTYEADTTPGHTSWGVLRYNYSYTEPRTRKNIWEKIDVYEEKYNHETKKVEKTGNLVPIWRKPKQTRTQNSFMYASELTVSKTPEGKSYTNTKDKGFSVALHEFAHRVESTTPYIKIIEHNFLKRRAGGFTETPEKISSIYSHQDNEFGYKDNFPTHYMGKVYMDGSREVLSMGMETLFAGTNGGFVGINEYKPDTDYKRFILGILASSIKK